MNQKNEEKCLKCDFCELEDFFWDGKRLCFMYHCRRFHESIHKAALKCPESREQDLAKAEQCIHMLREHLYGRKDKE